MSRTSAQTAHLQALHARGFDRSRITERGAIRVKCSQCEAAVINDVACHESGCPNRTGECDECGAPCHRRHRLCDDCYQNETEQQEFAHDAGHLGDMEDYQ